jgi:hypothetical protein
MIIILLNAATDALTMVSGSKASWFRNKIVTDKEYRYR